VSYRAIYIQWRLPGLGSRVAVTRTWRLGRQYCGFWWSRAGSFAPPACLHILCCAILAWKAAVHMIFHNHRWVSFNRTMHLFTPRKLNFLLLPCPVFGMRFLTSCFVSSIVARENPPLAILAIFKARCILHCSSCTWHPCLALVADMIKTYKKLVTASKRKIRLLPQLYTTP